MSNQNNKYNDNNHNNTIENHRTLQQLIIERMVKKKRYLYCRNFNFTSFTMLFLNSVICACSKRASSLSFTWRSLKVPSLSKLDWEGKQTNNT